MSITISAGVRQNLQSLQATADLMASTQKKLATGKKVNGALDNPASFFTASTLKGRANDLSTLLDGMATARKTIEAADKGLTSITKLVESAKSVVKQVQQDIGTNANTVTGTLSGAGLLTATTKLNTLGFADNDRLVLDDTSSANSPDQVLIVTSAANTTVQDLIDRVNRDTAGQYSAKLEDGNLKISGANQFAVDVRDSAGPPVYDDAATEGLLGVTAAAIASTSVVTEQAKLNAFAKQYNDILTQITQVAQDAGYGGKNLLDGNNVVVNFNEKATSMLTVQGSSFSALSLNLAAVSTTAADTNTFTTQDSKLTTALGTVRQKASDLGSTLSIMQAREDFTKGMIDTLESGADGLVLADTNMEAANMLALQTRQQLASTSLSLASQADQAVLRLF
jgi:flagellin